MPKVYNPGERVQGMTVVRQVHSGAMAVSYEARTATGDKVFLKQYKSPTVRVKWYPAFMAYQEEMRRRIEGPECKDSCYRFLGGFEFERCFFQTFEFLDRSDSLQQVLDRCAKDPASVSWEQRRLMARVLLSGIRMLHGAKIVHADLKPDNIMLIHDESIRMKYRLKIIDLDFSLFTDRQAPWHGHEGYFGTPGYASPEHMQGKVPLPASDVFTCGLMLYDLLGQGHPYRAADDYGAAVVSGKAPPPKLLDRMPAPARDDVVVPLLHRCLSPDPSRRPGANELFEALVGNGAPPPPPAAAPPPPPPVPKRPGRLRLRGEANGEEMTFGARTVVGKVLCARFGEQHIYCSEAQFVLGLDEGGWFVEPPSSAPRNATLLNGSALARRERLKEGDVLGVGRPGGRSHLPMRVSLVV